MLLEDEVIKSPKITIVNSIREVDLSSRRSDFLTSPFLKALENLELL